MPRDQRARRPSQKAAAAESSSRPTKRSKTRPITPSTTPAAPTAPIHIGSSPQPTPRTSLSPSQHPSPSQQLHQADSDTESAQAQTTVPTQPVKRVKLLLKKKEDSIPDSSPPPGSLLNEFVFQSNWKVVFKKEGLRNKLHVLHGDDKTWWLRAYQWTEEKIDTTKYIIDRQELEAWHDDLPIRRRLKTEISIQHEFDYVMQQVIEWWRLDCTGIHVDITNYLTKDDLLPSQQQQQQQQESQEDVEQLQQPPMLRKQASTAKKPRSSATTRQLDQLPESIAATEATGNQLVILRQRWPCQAKGCKNLDHWCYIYGVDRPENHYPLTDHVVARWSQLMRAKPGVVTEHEPPTEIFDLLAKHRADKVAAKHYNHRGRQQQQDGQLHGQLQLGQQPFVNNNNVYLGSEFRGYQPTNYPGNKRPGSPGEPPSSQTTTPAADAVDSFFNWLQTSSHWSTELELLKDVKEVLVNEAYDLRGLRDMDLTEWRQLRQPAGLLARLQRSLTKYNNNKKRSPPAEPVSTTFADE